MMCISNVAAYDRDVLVAASMTGQWFEKSMTRRARFLVVWRDSEGRITEAAWLSSLPSAAAEHDGAELIYSTIPGGYSLTELSQQ